MLTESKIWKENSYNTSKVVVGPQFTFLAPPAIHDETDSTRVAK